MSNWPILRAGDLSLAKNFSVAWSRVSDKTNAFSLFKDCPKCSKETPNAKISPNESQRK